MHRILLIIFIVLYTSTVDAQKVRFDQITNESGRSLGFVTGMVQDSTGFMWMATRGGLYRYDGYSYKLFRHQRKDSTSLPHNDLTYLYLDRDENLWMRHYKNLFAFKNEQLVDSFGYINNNTFDITTQILQDKYRNYWIGPVQNSLIRRKPSGQVDTFTMAKELIHPGIVKWCRNTQPRFITDSAAQIEVKQRQTFLAVSCGEGSNGNFYDYGIIKQNDKIIYSANNHLKAIDSESLFRMSANLVTFEAGIYSLNFKADNSNSFEDAIIPLSKYGIALYPVREESEIANLAKIQYFPENTIHANTIKDLKINNNGIFSLLTDNGIHLYKDNSWHSIEADLAKHLGDVMMQGNYNMPFFQSKTGDYWAGTHKGLMKINESGITEHLLFSNPVNLFSIKEDYQNNIYLATSNGLYYYNPQARTLKHYKQNNQNRLYDNEVRDVIEDRSHNLWIATKEGLNRLRPSRFQYTDLGMENFSPYPILKVEKDRFITAGQSNLLHYFSIGNGTEKNYALPEEIFPVDDFSGDTMYDITDMMLLNNRLIIAYSNRLALFSYPTLDLISYKKIPYIPVDGQSIDNHALYLIKSPQKIWAVAIDGLYAFDLKLDSMLDSISFNFNYKSVFDIDHNFVKDLKKIGDTYLIRTASNLFKFNAEKNKLQNIFSFPKSILQTSLADGNLFFDRTTQELWLAILPDIYYYNTKNHQKDTISINLDVDLGNCNTYVTDSLIWVTTNNGLVRINKNTEAFIHYTSSDGLADNNNNAVYPDIHGNVWVTSFKGLTKMDIKNEKTETFFRTNDFQSLSFLRKHYRHPEFQHQQLLPTNSGYMRFNPDSLNPFKPPIVISNIYLFGKQASFDSLAHEKQHIELPFDKNFITFELASLDYTKPSKNRFRYKLQNFNDQWIYTGANNRKAPYTGLPPGDYTFVAQGTNNDGIWSNPLKLRLIIHPPWYRTLVAYISYVVFIILSIVLFIRYRERKLKEEKRILEEKVRERTAKIRHQRDEIAEQKKDITDSIHYASRIQSALLPSDEFAKSILNSYFILFKPRDIVSGDYYWLTQVGNKTIVVAADCTGHGVPGAFMSMLGVAFLNEIVVRDKTMSTNEILDRLREYVMKSLKQTDKQSSSKDGMDIALTIINHDTLEAQFSGAYNPLYLLRDGEIETIKADRMPIGVHIKASTPFSKNEVKLQKGDRLYMFSDGYPDQFGGKDGRKFMSKRFKREIIATGHLDMNGQKEELDRIIEEWKGDRYEQIDDIIVIGIEI